MIHRASSAVLYCASLAILLSCSGSPSSATAWALPQQAARSVARAESIAGEAVTIAEFSTGVPRGHHPMDITLGPDGAMWFVDPVLTDSGTNYVVRVAPNGSVVRFPFFVASGFPILQSIVTGPDRALWMTDFDDGLIARMTTDGKSTVYGIPGVNTYPGGIVVGSDGALWFTEPENFTIGRITTRGTVTQYHSGINGDPFGLAAGPDGALWFTEYFEGRIGRITTAGAVTEYSAGIPNGAQPNSIATGPDGALWFTESNAIGRITTGGTVTQFTQGLWAGQAPQEITPGPDGAMWFTMRGKRGPRLGRITTAGAITQYGKGISARSWPFGIYRGLGDTIWFTEMSGDRVARATL